MARSIQTVVSSGSLVILGVTLEYYERDDITVYFDDVAQLAGWGWVGTTDKTIVFYPAVPAGVTVKLQRRTDVDRMKHVFTSGAQFKNTNVDTNFLQLLHAVQEIQESGVPPSAVGGLDMANEKITSLAPGTAGSDAVNKAQLDTAIAGVSGAALTFSNIGAAGAGVYKETVGGNVRLKKLVQGANMTLTETSDGIVLEATGTGGVGYAYFANIADYGAIGDFVPAAGSTGTGTDNTAAVTAALATGKPLWIPAGNFLVTAAVQAALNNTTTTGPGTLWINTNVGITKFGKMLSIGSTRSHEMQSVGGIKLGGESGDGFRWYMGHHNWSQIQPTKYGAPTQFQLYPSVVCGLATTTSPNVLKAVHGSFDASRMTVGDHIGFGNEVFKIASFISPTQITVTKFDGSSPSFDTNNTQRTFYHAYEIAQGTCNVNGTAVTYLSGEQYPFGVSQDHMYAIINGTKYNVSSGPESVGANSLTLAVSAGTLSNATIEFRRCWGYWAYVTLLRLQGLGGGIETNCGLYLNIRNEAVLFNSGYGSTYYGDMRVNANKIYLGCGDGTGGTESMEIGSDYNSLGGLYGGESVRVHKSPGGAANRIDIIGGASSFAPAIAMRSSTEANQSLGFDLQGNGTFRFTAGTFGRTVAEISATAGTNTWPTLAAGTGKAVFSVNSGTGIGDVELAPGGTGKTNVRRMPFVKLRMVGALRLETATLIPWDTEVSDIFGMHAPNDTKIYVPVAGLYRVSAQFQAQFYGAAAGRTSVSTRIDIKKNGASTMAELGCMTQHRYESGLAAGSNQTYDLVLAAGDYIEIRAVQVSYGSGDSHADIDTTDVYTGVTVALVTGT